MKNNLLDKSVSKFLSFKTFSKYSRGIHQFLENNQEKKKNNNLIKN